MNFSTRPRYIQNPPHSLVKRARKPEFARMADGAVKLVYMKSVTPVGHLLLLSSQSPNIQTVKNLICSNSRLTGAVAILATRIYATVVVDTQAALMADGFASPVNTIYVTLAGHLLLLPRQYPNTQTVINLIDSNSRLIAILATYIYATAVDNEKNALTVDGFVNPANTIYATLVGRLQGIR